MIELMLAKSRENEKRLHEQEDGTGDVVGRWLGLEGFRVYGLSPTQLVLGSIATASAAIVAASYFYRR